MPSPSRPSIVVFDLGGVLFDWDPRHLYRTLFDDEPAMERFLVEVVSHAWNVKQDAGRPFAEAIAEAKAEHPDHAAMIDVYFDRWPEMLRGAIDGSVALLRELHGANVPLYALTNWSSETFTHARAYPFMDLFRGIVVSAEVGLVKPDPAIFAHLLETIGATAGDCVFIDDAPVNVEAARALGFVAVRFESPEKLRAELAGLGLPVEPYG